jgi:hypothetical protein
MRHRRNAIRHATPRLLTKCGAPRSIAANAREFILTLCPAQNAFAMRDRAIIRKRRQHLPRQERDRRRQRSIDTEQL